MRPPIDLPPMNGTRPLHSAAGQRQRGAPAGLELVVAIGRAPAGGDVEEVEGDDVDAARRQRLGERDDERRASAPAPAPCASTKRAIARRGRAIDPRRRRRVTDGEAALHRHASG